MLNLLVDEENVGGFIYPGGKIFTEFRLVKINCILELKMYGFKCFKLRAEDFYEHKHVVVVMSCVCEKMF